MKKEFDDTFLARWLSNTLSEEERKAFEESKDYALYQKIVQGANMIQQPEFDKDAMLARINSERNKTITPKSNARRGWSYGIAASIVVLIGIFILNTDFFNRETIASSYGEQVPVTLPDGSEVILNSRSEIIYQKKNWEYDRTISLNGEAYFKVEKGQQFIVETNWGKVMVLGTQFNVQVINGFFEVSCYEGKVRVSTSKDQVDLTPGKKYRLLNNQSNILAEGMSAPGWINNESVFKGVPVKYVLIALENQFNIQFEGSFPDNQLTFTGSFPHDNLTVALKVVLGSLQIDYHVQDNKTIVLENKQ